MNEQEEEGDGSQALEVKRENKRMMSIQCIRDASDRAARKASREKRTPYVPFDAAEIDGYEQFPFPNIGSYSPRGWEHVESLFCDASGFGSPNEPALTKDQLKAKLKEYLEKEETFGYAVTEVGQFQLHLGVFRKL